MLNAASPTPTTPPQPSPSSHTHLFNHNNPATAGAGADVPATPNFRQNQSSHSHKMQSNPCFRCGEQGHWLKDCPSKTPSKSNSSPSSTPSISPDVSRLPAIFCPKGHGTNFPKVSGTQKNPGRVFYSYGYRINVGIGHNF